MTENICPYLGSLGDPLSCTTCATEDNLCYATGEGELITKPHQKKHCLSGKMTGCPHFPVESTLSSFSTPARLPATDSVGTGKVGRQAARSNHKNARRGAAEAVAPYREEALDGESLLIEADEDIDVFGVRERLGSEDAYFDALASEPGAPTNSTPDDFYFDDLEKAMAAAPKSQPPHSGPAAPSGETVLMELNAARGTNKAPQAYVAPAQPASSPEKTALPRPATPVVPSAAPQRTAPVAPSVAPPRNAAAQTVPSPEAPAASAASLFDDTTVVPKVQRPPVPETKPTPPKTVDLGLPEPVQPAPKPVRAAEKHPQRDYAGADPSWLARQAAEQAKPAAAVSAPSPLPATPRPIKPPPALVPNPMKARGPERATPPLTAPLPDQFPPVAKRPRQSRTFLYLSLGTGLVAILLVCVGTLVLRSDVLGSGSRILASIDVTSTVPAVALAMPTETATEQSVQPTSTAPVSLAAAATSTPAATAQPTEMPTSTSIAAAAPANTATLASTATSVPATATSAPSATQTPEPPPASPTATALPTETAAPSATASPTPAPSSSPTATPIPPSATPAPTTAPTDTPQPAPSATTPSAEAPVAAVALAAPKAHIVQAGDTPYDIASLYGITAATLLAANPGVDPRSLHIGQKLNVPTGSEAPASEPTATVAPTTTPTAAPLPSPTVMSTYVVKAGDTFAGIAADLGLDTTDLVQANPGLDPKLLHIGQEISIVRAGGSAPTRPPAVAVAAASSAPAAAKEILATYVVKPGDTLLGIAIRYDLTTEDLQGANPGLESQFLQIGQEIKVPQVVNAAVPAVAAPLPAAEQEALAPVRIVASAIQLDAKVVSIAVRKELQDGSVTLAWDEPDGAAGFHTDSTVPGQTGNVVMSGANSGKGELFRNIGDLKEGDQIQVYAGDKTYGYQVDRVLMMPDKYISAEKRRANDAWLAQTSDNRLTLVSYGPYPTTAQRVLVIAHPQTTQ